MKLTMQRWHGPSISNITPPSPGTYPQGPSLTNRRSHSASSFATSKLSTTSDVCAFPGWTLGEDVEKIWKACIKTIHAVWQMIDSMYGYVYVRYALLDIIDVIHMVTWLWFDYAYRYIYCHLTNTVLQNNYSTTHGVQVQMIIFISIFPPGLWTSTGCVKMPQS